jgi:hypothetical protein
MKLHYKILLFLFITFVCSTAFGKIREFKNSKEIQRIPNSWHRIAIPDRVYSKSSGDFSDIRIFGVTTNNDTIQAFYIENTVDPGGNIQFKDRLWRWMVMVVIIMVLGWFSVRMIGR